MIDSTSFLGKDFPPEETAYSDEKIVGLLAHIITFITDHAKEYFNHTLYKVS